jgi:hypothetical protein
MELVWSSSQLLISLEEKLATSDIAVHSKNIIGEAYLSIFGKSQYSFSSSYA